MTQRQSGRIFGADCAVLASGAGSNFAALAKAFPGRIAALITDNPDAGVVGIAHELSVNAYVCARAEYQTRRMHETALLEQLRSVFVGTKLRFLLLAGYMRILSPQFLQDLSSLFGSCRIWNLHPAYPSAYKGGRAYEFAVQHRFPYWGITIHQVTADLDSGPVVASVEAVVYPWETASALKARLQPMEHQLFIQALKDEECQ